MIEWLHPDTPFPSTERALPEGSDAPGLLAAGADLSVARLHDAYSRGIFPWYGPDQPILWWAPAPRMVLEVAHFKVSRSLRKTLQHFRRSAQCEIRIDHDVATVLRHCAQSPREGQNGTWIVDEMQAAYHRWYRAGGVHSVEVWIDGTLRGGLYGVGIGKMFFGESMFSLQSDASKIALAALVSFCRSHGVEVIDCQQETSHLSSLGGTPWPRKRFEAHLAEAVTRAPPTEWTYHEAMWEHLIPEPFSPISPA